MKRPWIILWPKAEESLPWRWPADKARSLIHQMVFGAGRGVMESSAVSDYSISFNRYTPHYG